MRDGREKSREKRVHGQGGLLQTQATTNIICVDMQMQVSVRVI